MTDFAPDELGWRRSAGPTTLRLPVGRRPAGHRSRHRGRRQPMYWRVLGLRRLRPNGWQRALLGEGAAAVAAVLVLADVASAWTLLVLPMAVAAVVKGHDVLASVITEPVEPAMVPLGLLRLRRVAARPRGRHRQSRQGRSERDETQKQPVQPRHRHRAPAGQRS